MHDEIFNVWLKRTESKNSHEYITDIEIKAILFRPKNSAKEFVDDIYNATEKAAKTKGHFKKKDAYVINYMQKRRETHKKYIEQYSKKYAEYRLWSPEVSFMKLEYAPPADYIELDDDYEFTLAAALWLLDELYTQDRIDEACEYLPEASESYDSTLLYNFYHPCYSNSLINSVTQLINYTKYSSQFKSVVDLLEPGRIEKAIESLDELQEKAIDAYMRAEEYYDRKKYRIAEELNNLKADNALLVRDKKEKESRRNQLAGELKDNDAEQNEFRRSFETFFGCHDEKVMKSRKLAKMMEADIKDPYEICFALAYRLSQEDAATWLETSLCAALRAACRMLPWYEYLDGDYDDAFAHAINGGWLNQKQPEGGLDIYHQFEKDGLNPAQRIYRMSRGIVPHRIHPFETQRQQMHADKVKGADLITTWADLLFMSINQYDTMDPAPEDEYLWDDDDAWYTNDDEEKEEPVCINGIHEAGEPYPNDHEKETGKLEELRRKLAEVKKQNKTLRTAMSESKRAYKAALESTEKELADLRMEHRELADLRELVFNREHETEDGNAATEPDIEFPYVPRQRTVVFGGHDTFLKEFRKRLPDTPCVSTKIYSFDTNIIRNADVVWIQNNCISHSQYWYVIRTAKKCGVQVRYFSYVSAEKCAIQLAAEDMQH